MDGLSLNACIQATQVTMWKEKKKIWGMQNISYQPRIVTWSKQRGKRKKAIVECSKTEGVWQWHWVEDEGYDQYSFTLEMSLGM